ncbi:MAG: hypothetical protein QOK43_1963 [Acidimicrobiaceae bacterium]|nr:hypothetical protein [Acidimicrobiaceae bacterium]MDQ1444912.1 hypothetical protein [Acidimicrobiaceae bacterium]
MVLLILAGIWAAVLVPWVRSRVEPGAADSIGDFRRQLGVLQRTGPATVAPANRLRVPPYQPGVPNPYGAHYAVRRSAPASLSSPDAARRARTLKRRRDVLFSLLGGMTGTLVLGLLPPFHLLLVLHVLLDLAFAGYIGLLVQMRNAAAERDMKLRFLPGAMGAMGSSMPDAIPARVRSAN